MGRRQYVLPPISVIMKHLRTCIKDGFTIHDGHPSFNKTWTDPINAKQFAAELVKHNYREGWKLPDMPR